MLTPSNSSHPTQGDHIQDLHNLLQGMTLSDPSLDTITWSHKTTKESITLSKSSLSQSVSTSTHTCPKTSVPMPHSTTTHLHHASQLPSATPSMPSHLHPQASQTVTQTPCQVMAAPKPSDIHPPRADETPEGFWVIMVGQEVGVFYCWADVAEWTNFISGNIQKRYPSFQQALLAYTVKYNKGRVQAVPLPGGPFWPSPHPPSPTLSANSSASSDSYDLWLQVEDLTETMSQL